MLRNLVDAAEESLEELSQYSKQRGIMLRLETRFYRYMMLSGSPTTVFSTKFPADEWLEILYLL